MNWNLKKNSVLTSIILILLAHSQVKSQSKQDFELGLSISPSLNFSQVKGNEWNNYLTASKSVNATHFSFQAHAWVKKSIGKNSDFQIGIGYADLGFERTQKNLKFMDPTYPGIGSGVIPDISSADKNITYTYHFRNFQVPVIWNTLVGHSKDYKVKLYASAGLVLNTLLSHSLSAETANGYLINSQSKFELDSTSLSPSRFSIQLQLGCKAVYKLDKNKSLFVQPLLGFFPFSITNGITSVHPVLLQIQVGITLPFEKK